MEGGLQEWRGRREEPVRSLAASPSTPSTPPPPLSRPYWLTLADGAVPAEDGWLGPRERTVLAGLRLPKRRAEWRLGRCAAKRLLSAVLPEAPAPEIVAAEDGAPEAWWGNERVPLALSLGHRGGLAVCAVAAAGTALGCDVERVEPRSAAFVRDYFTEAEQALVAAADDRALAANLVWSGKEAALKALREGLRLDTRAVEVVLPDGATQDGWRPLAVDYHAERRRFAGWWREEAGFVFTLVGEPAPGVPVRVG